MKIMTEKEPKEINATYDGDTDDLPDEIEEDLSALDLPEGYVQNAHGDYFKKENGMLVPVEITKNTPIVPLQHVFGIKLYASTTEMKALLRLLLFVLNTPTALPGS